MITKATLQVDEVAVGHCVIINDVEQPCGRLVSVVVAVDGDVVVTKYLNADPVLTPYNKTGVANRRETVTPCGHFGVSVVVNSDGQYLCEPVAESRATYSDGDLRPWQEYGPARWFDARADVLSLALSEATS